VRSARRRGAIAGSDQNYAFALDGIFLGVRFTASFLAAAGFAALGPSVVRSSVSLMMASLMESITLFAAFGTRSSFMDSFPPSCCPSEASLNDNLRANTRAPNTLKTAMRDLATEASALDRLARMLQSARAMTATRPPLGRKGQGAALDPLGPEAPDPL